MRYGKVHRAGQQTRHGQRCESCGRRLTDRNGEFSDPIRLRGWGEGTLLMDVELDDQTEALVVVEFSRAYVTCGFEEWPISFAMASAYVEAFDAALPLGMGVDMLNFHPFVTEAVAWFGKEGDPEYPPLRWRVVITANNLLGSVLNETRDGTVGRGPALVNGDGTLNEIGAEAARQHARSMAENLRREAARREAEGERSRGHA